MKSKPANSKKVKVEVTSLAPPGTPDNQKGSNVSTASPAGTSSSGAASSQNIPSNGGNSRPSSGGDGASSTGKASSSKSKAGDKGSGVASAACTYPTLTHFSLTDFPKINACIVGSKGAAAGASTGTVSEANKPIENLTMEDIDTLQAELETLWSSVACRIRTLQREEGALQSAPSSSSHHNLGLEHFDPQHQEKIAAVDAIIGHGTRTSVSAAAKLVMGAQLAASSSPVPSPSPQAGPSSSGTTKKGTAKGERLPKKKLKGEGGVLGKAKKGGEKPAARATQNRTHSVSSDVGTDGLLKQHEIPNQFWDSVDEYCREITPDDIQKLQGIIDDQQKLPEDIYTIPPLGKHFKDDEETAKRKARESRIASTKDQVGPLTQRLVAALVEEKVAAYKSSQEQRSPNEDASTASSSSAAGSSNPEGTFVHRPGLVKALGLDGAGASGANAVPLESRIKDCLLQHGLLLPEDAGNDDPDDEILAEIKRSQNLLRKLHCYNADRLKALLDVAKRELLRYELQRQLDKADKDVIEAYKVIQNCRVKKKPVTKKEKDAAFKAMDVRKKVLQKLDAIPPIDPADTAIVNQLLAAGKGKAGPSGPSSTASAGPSTSKAGGRK